MKLLPLDIKQQQFRKLFRGFAPSEVQTFLEVVAQAFEELIVENNSLKDDLRRHINQVNEYREREGTLKDTMLTAQKISEEMKISAKKEADLLLKEAELKAERILGDVHQKMVKIMDRIQELKLERDRFAISLRTLVEKHLKLLETGLEDVEDRADKEVNLAYLKTIRNKSNE